MDNHIHKSNAGRISALEKEIQVLREQVQTLTRELDDERQQKNSYRKELEYAIEGVLQILSEANIIPNVQMLELDKPQELARGILKSNKSAGEFLDELIVAMERFTAEIDNLEQIAKTTFGKKYLMMSKLNMCKAEYYKLSIRLNEFQAIFIELMKHFFSLKAQLDKYKSQIYRRET